jgi:hypothetical protein
MVVEYVGEVVRRSVVGLREAREYNAFCGAGTYVFGCSDGLCIDATRVRDEAGARQAAMCVDDVATGYYRAAVSPRCVSRMPRLLTCQR